MSKNFSVFFLLIVFSGIPVQAEQHEVLSKVVSQVKHCGQNYFSPTPNPSLENLLHFSGETYSLPKAKVKQLNLFPVNNCVLRGNRYLYDSSNINIFKNLKINTLFRLEALSYSTEKLANAEIVSLPMKVYSKTDKHELQTIAKVLDLMASASPDSRVAVSCYYGKHRTGLLVAMYQFMYEYVQNPEKCCQNYSASNDQVFQQMNKIAEVGLLTYDQPDKFKSLYLNFAKAVCAGKTEEFFNANTH